MSNNSLSNKDIIHQRNQVRNAAWQFNLPFVCIVALLYVDRTSLFSYGYALLLLLISAYYICRREIKDLLFAYHFYLLFAIVFTLIFKSQFPEYLGMSGLEGVFGTDDCRFYAQVVSGRGLRYTVAVSIIDIMPYSKLLKVYYPFYVYTPLNILTPSLLFTAYIPIFVRRFSNLLTNDLRIGKYAFWYSLLCPFTLYFGCIIMRESFTALMVIAGLCYFLQNKFLPLAICIAALIWVRFGTLAFLLCGIILLTRFKLRRKARTDFYFIILLLLIIYAFYYSYDFLQVYSHGKLNEGLIRSTEGERYENTTIGEIIRLPFPLNIILSTFFFIFIPLFSIPQPHFGHYLIGGFFQGFLTPLFMFFLWKPIFNTSLLALFEHKQEAAKKLFYIAVLFALILGTISMQSRHKTVLFPILCMLAAYGQVNINKTFNKWATMMAGAVILIQIVMVTMSFL